MVSSVSLEKTQPELNSKELKKVCWMAPKEVAKNTNVSNTAILNLQSPISPSINGNVNCFSPTESLSMNLALLDVFTHQLTPPHTQPYFSPNSEQCGTSPNMTAIASPNIFADDFKNGPTTPQFCSPPYFPQVASLPLLPSASQSLKDYFDSMATPLMDPYKLPTDDKPSEKPPTPSMTALPIPRQLLDQRRDSSSSHSSDQVSTSTAPSEKPMTVPSALRIQTNYQSPNVAPSFTSPQSLSSPTTPSAPTSAPSAMYPGLPFISEISQNMIPLSQFPVRNYDQSHPSDANPKQQLAAFKIITKDPDDVQIKRPSVPYVPESKPRKMHPAVFKCAFQGCPKVFTRPYNLRSHMKIHTGEKLFCCEFCDAKFTRGHDLKRHTRLHTDERPFQCTRCLRSFSRSDALRRHQKVDNCPPLGEDESYTPEEREALLQKEYQRQELLIQKKMAKRRAKQKETEVLRSNVEDVFMPDNRAEFRADFVVGNEMLGNF